MNWRDNGINGGLPWLKKLLRGPGYFGPATKAQHESRGKYDRSGKLKGNCVTTTVEMC